VKFRLREIAMIFPLKYAVLRFGKYLNYLISDFQRGDILKINAEQERSSQINFSVPERHRWAVVG